MMDVHGRVQGVRQGSLGGQGVTGRSGAAPHRHLSSFFPVLILKVNQQTQNRNQCWTGGAGAEGSRGGQGVKGEGQGPRRRHGHTTRGRVSGF